MARVTVEDCIEKVKNRFELVLMATRRAKDIDRGVLPSVPRDNDKPTIIALREIAEETISLDGLRELAKRGLIEDRSQFIDANPTTDSVNLLAEELGTNDEEDDEDEDGVGEEFDEEDIAALRDLDAALDEDTPIQHIDEDGSEVLDDGLEDPSNEEDA